MIHIPTEGVDNGVSNVQSPKTSTKKKVMGPSRVSILVINIYLNDSTLDIRYVSKYYLTKVLNKQFKICTYSGPKIPKEVAFISKNK